MLRPHIDMFRSNRVLFALTEQGTDFRHVFGTACISMRAGEVWGVDGSVCHGAANVASSGYRVLLVLDVRSAPDADRVHWFNEHWAIPLSALVQRKIWTPQARRRVLDRARSIAELGQWNLAEREWLFLPFEYEVPADYTYAELIEFCEQMSREAVSLDAASHWRCRAERIANPELAFEAAAPLCIRERDFFNCHHRVYQNHGAT